MVQKYTKWYFLEPFLTNKEKIHLNEISRILNKPHPVVRRHLNRFCEEGILKKELKGRQVFYSLNEEYPLIVDLLSLSEKEKLLKKSNRSLLLKEIVLQLHSRIVSPVLIFGSFVEKSKSSKDIDLLVVNPSSEEKDSIKEVEKKIGKNIHLIDLKKLEDASPAFKEEIFQKHLIINNSELFIRWFH